MDRTVSFSVNQVCGVFNKDEWLQTVHQALTVKYKEDDIYGVQVYPSEWPRKIRILVKSAEVKEELLVHGLDVYSQHVELQDDQFGPPITVTVLDMPLEMPFDKVEHILGTYGDITKVRDEYLVVNGRQTTWKTGTRMVTINAVKKRIPEKITISDNCGRPVTIFLRCDRQMIPQTTRTSFCRNCGSTEHLRDECMNDKRLCYGCGSDEHLQHKCPRKIHSGFRENEDVYCFRGEKAVLSNFNRDYPIVVKEQRFNCNEQFIVYSKAMLFGDDRVASEVMKMSNPRMMKQLGNNIDNYNHREWQRKSVAIIAQCNETKFSMHQNAMDVLMSTGHKVIGEATAGKEWGIGLSLNDDDCLQKHNWSGENKMGKILMKIRDNQHQKLDGIKPPNQPPAEMVKSQVTIEPQASCVQASDSVDCMQASPSIHQDCGALVHDASTPIIPAAGDGVDHPRTMPSSHQDCGTLVHDASTPTHSPAVEQKGNESESMDLSNASLLIESLEEQSLSDCAIVIGDFNVQELVLDDHDTDFNIEMLSEDDLKVSGVSRTLNRELTTSPDDVKVVLVHVGTCNFEKDSQTDLDKLYDEYVTMLHEVGQKFDKAMLIVSSILPRGKNNLYQHEFNKVNEEIGHFNEMIKSYCEAKPLIVFLDNDALFKGDFAVCEHLYKIHDESGAHLGRRGLETLEEVFKKSLNDTYYQHKLHLEFDVKIQSQ